MQSKHLAALIMVMLLLIVGGYFAFFSLFVPDAESSPKPVGVKLNINEICDGALAYMTFPGAEAAATFVVECKEGKHPEVIEEYKRQNGFTDDAAI